MYKMMFKAQALDNSSDDHYQICGTVRSAEDVGAVVTSAISSIARNGRVLMKDGPNEVVVYKSSTLIQIVGNERDGSNRLAPIVGCFDIGGGVSATMVAEMFSTFATSIGRTIDVDVCLKLCGRVADEVKKPWLKIFR